MSNYAEEMIQEYWREAQKWEQELNDLVSEHVDLLAWAWRVQGDDGQTLIDKIKEAVFAYDPSLRPEPRYKKKAIGAGIRRQVYERDKYRCVRCGTYKDLSVDHIHPESKGGKTVLENLQTLCRPCNSSKGARVPRLTGISR